ncbi:PAS domain S-box protein [Pannus brasiliensis CCIBt3594]|uniref:histidine kinase n=1 Tax=Pannus brasiliensis CCIBt3594 TaxID=1427578 RepID=A0AAW9QVX0_9CHRO
MKPSERTRGEQRLRALLELTDRTDTAKTVASACHLVAESLSSLPVGIPFATIYRVSAGEQRADLAATTLDRPSAVLTPRPIDLSAGTDLWNLSSVWKTGERALVRLPEEVFEGCPPIDTGSRVFGALVVPIFGGGRERAPLGFLILGTSSRTERDAEEREFRELLIERIARAIANADEREKMSRQLERARQEIARYERERERVEADPRESQVRLQEQLAEIEALYQTAPIGLAVLDTGLHFVRINERLAEINGLSVPAHIGRTVRELLPDLADTAEAIPRPILETGEPRLNVELRGETPARPGEQRISLESFLPLKQGDRVIGISAVCEEITERRRAEEALRESEERFRQMAETISDVFWMMDLDRERVLYISPAFDRIWGRPREELYRRWGAGFAYIHPDDRQQVADATARSPETDGFDIEYRVVRPDGAIRYLRDRGFVIAGERDRSTCLVGVAGDITDRKLAELQLRQQADELKALNEALERATDRLTERNNELDRFVYTVSHDLKAPLRAIANLSEWIAEDLEGQLSGDSLHQLELLRGRVARMNALIDGLLAYSRIGRTEVATEKVCVSELLGEILDSLAPPATFRISVESDLPQYFSVKD